MQVPIAKLLGFDNQLLNMSCQTGDYNFSSYGTWRPSGFRTEGKMGTQTFSIASENTKGKPYPKDSTFCGIFCRQSIST